MLFRSYKLLKKLDNFVWTKEAEAALAQLKYTLTHAPILAAPKEREPLLLYVSATKFVISAVIVVERLEEGKQWPDQHDVYFISEVFSDSKQRYPHYQKLAFGVFFCRQKAPALFP